MGRVEEECVRGVGRVEGECEGVWGGWRKSV